MRKLFTLILFTIVCICSKAQSGSWRFGFTGSPNFASLKPVENGITKGGTKIGFNYGFIADYGISDVYFISTGIQITSTGSSLTYAGNQWTDKQVGIIKADNSSSSNKAEYNLRFQHLDIPIALKLKTDSKSKMQYWGSFGANVSLLLKARTDFTSNITVGGVSNYSKENENIIGDIQPFNLGMQLGAGIEYPLTDRNNILVGLIYNNGFIDVTRNSKWGNDGRVNLNNFTVKIGLFF